MPNIVEPGDNITGCKTNYRFLVNNWKRRDISLGVRPLLQNVVCLCVLCCTLSEAILFIYVLRSGNLRHNYESLRRVDLIKKIWR